MGQNKTDLTKFKNQWFDPGAGLFKRAIWFLVNALFFINPLNPFINVKIWLLRKFGASVGKRVIIKPRVNIKYPWNLKIGDFSWVGECVWIDSLAPVHIGSHVCISQGAYLLTGNHNYKKIAFDLMVDEIKIEDGTWIGAKAIVSPGVHCRSHSVLAAGSVATSEMQPYTIYQGNPAKKVRKRVIQA